MINATITGNLGRDAETKQAGGSTVCEFSVASTTKIKGEKQTQWVRASLWGKRGESLARYLVKGQSVAVAGELTIREHNGKAYADLRVSEIDLIGGKRDDSRAGAGTHREASAPTGGGGFDDADYGDNGETLPF